METQDISQLLESWGYQQNLIDKFKDEGIEFCHLNLMTEYSLEKLFPKIGERITFMKKLKSLQVQEIPAKRRRVSCDSDGTSMASTCSSVATNISSSNKLTLEELLNGPDGKMILSYYKMENKLTDYYRQKLADEIVEHELRHDMQKRWKKNKTLRALPLLLPIKNIVLKKKTQYRPSRLETKDVIIQYVKTLISCVVACAVVSLTRAANEYLPPQKGYNYEPPNVPFPTDNNANKQPAPFRPPPPTRGPAYVPPPPGPNPPPQNHDHSHDDHHHHEPGMPFDFAYSVNEDGNDFSHNAVSDGDVTRGEYRVALPDGRTQIVKYTADWKNGFNAEVTYEGEARYPDQPQGYPSGSAPGSGPGQQYVPPSQGGGYQY